MYLLTLSAERAESNGTQEHWALSAQILSSKSDSPAKETKFFGEMTDYRTEARKFRLCLEHIVVPENMFVCVCVYGVVQLCLTLCNPMECSLPGSCVHRVFQARILEWVAISFSRGSSWPRDWTCVSYIYCIGRQVLYPLVPAGKPCSKSKRIGVRQRDKGAHLMEFMMTGAGMIVVAK